MTAIISNHSGKSDKRLPVLIFVHNYLYLDNLTKIDYLYRERFSRIFHLMPLYDKERDDPHNQHQEYNIVPVQHTGFSFQNGFFQGFSSYEADNVSHYIFINDDLILNPQVNERNYQDFFNLSPNKSYLPSIDNHNNAYSILPWKHNFAYAKMENNLIERNIMLADEIPPPSVGKYMRAWLNPPPAWPHAMSAYNFRPHKKAFAKQLQKHSKEKVMMCSTLILRTDGLNRIDLMRAINSQIDHAKGWHQSKHNLMFRLHRANPKLHKLKGLRDMAVHYEQDMLSTTYDSKFFAELVLKKRAKKDFLFGFWQDASMLKNIKKELIKELKTDLGWTEDVKILKKEIKQKTEPVAIHFRHLFYEPLGLNHYSKAIEMIKHKAKDPSFYVFSDDNKKTKDLLKIVLPDGNYKLFPSYKDSFKAYQTLWLMADCKHFVMSRSTFCWWAAWLSWAQNHHGSQNLYLMPEKKL